MAIQWSSTAAANAASIVPKETKVVAAAPVNGTGLVPLPAAPPDVLPCVSPAVEVPYVPEVPFVAEVSRVKFAQFNRVVLAVWKTMDRLPKKAPIPSLVEVYRST